MATNVQSFTTEDIEYLRHGDKGLMLRLFRPEGAGPFPVVVDLHGGAWNEGDLAACRQRDEYLVERGIAAAAVNFRHGSDRYPSSPADINYAIRWLKAHAAELRLDPARVGITGVSSGGHLAMLAAMRPDDPRYGAIPLEGGAGVDATVVCAGVISPVINPLSRYRNALKLLASPNPPEWAGHLPERHHTYWVDEATMAEGNPMLALERGERLTLPPAMWVQRRPDGVHDYRDPDADVDVNEPERFARNYRKAGGDIELVYVDVDSRDAEALLVPLARFFATHL